MVRRIEFMVARESVSPAAITTIQSCGRRRRGKEDDLLYDDVGARGGEACHGGEEDGEDADQGGNDGGVIPQVYLATLVRRILGQ